MAKRNYTHTICQFQLRPDTDSWSAIVIAGKNMVDVRELFIRDKIAANTDLICGNQEFSKISDLMAYLEVADFSTPSDELPQLVFRKARNSDILTPGEQHED